MNRNIRSGLICSLLCLGAPAVLSASEPIVGTDDDDTIIGTENDDEIYGEDGNDRLQGGAGDDILVGGRGTDLLFGGSGSDQFIIDFISDLPDEVVDFRPEEGDTLLLRFQYSPQSDFKVKRPTIKNIEIDYDGDVTIQLFNEDQFDVVKLRRSDLTLKVDDLGDDIRLIFTKKIGK